MFMTFVKRGRLFDCFFLNEHAKEILSINEYIPSILRSVLMDINIKYSHTTSNKTLIMYSIRRKKLYSKFHKLKAVDLFYLTEILVFIESHPQFKSMIKDDDLLEDWIDYCEKTYNIKVINYINNYDNLEKLLKDMMG